MKTQARSAALACLGAAVLPLSVHAGPKDAKVEKIEEPAANNGDWCEWLQNRPGDLYRKKKNPWIQLFRLGGRFQYQAVYVDGNDVNGRDFHDTYDEYRRFRIESRTDFLNYFTLEANVNLVDDRRFRDDPLANDLDWGYDDFDEFSLQFDLGKAFGTGWFDNIRLKYGRMKLRITEEAHMSSKEIYTIERSAISDKLGGNASRPTGFTLELDKGDWELLLGVFSGEDDADFLGGWNDGEFFYGSLRWNVTDKFKLRLDHVQNNQSGIDDALGYAWGTSLAAIYQDDRFGVLLNAMYGDNGGERHNGHRQTRRHGDFHGFVIMPWYWVVENKLQAVASYAYQGSEESEGIRLSSRYLRERHDDPRVDVNNGRGDEHQSFYLGLNYHLCGDNLKIMGGVSYDRLATPDGMVEATTYLVGFRTFF